MSESSAFNPVSLVEQSSRFLLRLLDGLSPTALRYGDARRLARSLRRVQVACDEKLAGLEGAR